MQGVLTNAAADIGPTIFPVSPGNCEGAGLNPHEARSAGCKYPWTSLPGSSKLIRGPVTAGRFPAGAYAAELNVSRTGPRQGRRCPRRLGQLLESATLDLTASFRVLCSHLK